MQRPRPPSAHTHRRFHTLLKEARFSPSVHSMAYGKPIPLYVLGFSHSQSHTDTISQTHTEEQAGRTVKSSQAVYSGGWWMYETRLVWDARAHSHEGHSIHTSVSSPHLFYYHLWSIKNIPLGSTDSKDIKPKASQKACYLRDTSLLFVFIKNLISCRVRCLALGPCAVGETRGNCDTKCLQSKSGGTYFSAHAQ